MNIKFIIIDDKYLVGFIPEFLNGGNSLKPNEGVLLLTSESAIFADIVNGVGFFVE